MCLLWSDENLRLFLMFVFKFSTFEEKIEAPLTHVLSPEASIRENTVYKLKQVYSSTQGARKINVLLVIHCGCMVTVQRKLIHFRLRVFAKCCMTFDPKAQHVHLQ